VGVEVECDGHARVLGPILPEHTMVALGSLRVRVPGGAVMSVRPGMRADDRDPFIRQLAKGIAAHSRN
jgi:hypothetical protein